MSGIYNKVSLLWVALLASILIVSCTEHNPKPYDETEKMGFAPVVNRARSTKTIAQGTDYPVYESFMISAFFYREREDQLPEKSYIPTSQVTYNWGVWSTNRAYYWPLQGYMDFKAYSPATIEPYTTISSNDGVVITDYSICHSGNTKLETNLHQARVDVCFSEPLDEKIANANHPEYVPIVFKHALTQLAFSVKPKSYYTSSYTEGNAKITNSVRITVDEIGLNNIYYKGSFNQRLSSNVNEWDIYVKGEFDEEPDLYDYILLKRAAGNGTELIYDADNNPKLTPIMVDSDGSPTTPDEPLQVLLLPQYLNMNAALNVKYTVSQRVTKRVGNVVSEMIPEYHYQVERSIALQGNPVEHLQMGKKLNYIITIGLDAISLGAEYNDWSNNLEVVEPQ